MEYRVKYTLTKVVDVIALSEKEAIKIATDLEDFNYDFFGDEFLAEAKQEKTIATAMVFKNSGLHNYSKKIILDVPDKDQAFKDVEKLDFLQDTENFIEMRISSYTLKDGELIKLILDICKQKFSVN